jgi:hypothetical protein
MGDCIQDAYVNAEHRASNFELPSAEYPPTRSAGTGEVSPAGRASFLPSSGIGVDRERLAGFAACIGVPFWCRLS